MLLERKLKKERGNKTKLSSESEKKFYDHFFCVPTANQRVATDASCMTKFLGRRLQLLEKALIVEHQVGDFFLEKKKAKVKLKMKN